MSTRNPNRRKHGGTAVKIVVTALLSILLLRVWKRWLEPILVSVALILGGVSRPDIGAG